MTKPNPKCCSPHDSKSHSFSETKEQPQTKAFSFYYRYEYCFSLIIISRWLWNAMHRHCSENCHRIGFVSLAATISCQIVASHGCSERVQHSNDCFWISCSPNLTAPMRGFSVSEVWGRPRGPSLTQNSLFESHVSAAVLTFPGTGSQTAPFSPH